MATATSEQTKALVTRAFDALNERDRKAFAETHADDVVLHDHDEETRGVEVAIAHEWEIYDSFPDNHYALEHVVAEDDAVACWWTVTGTHKGEFQGLEPTGKSVRFPASGLFRIEDGKIAEVWLTYDRLGLMQQLGAIQPPGQ